MAGILALLGHVWVLPVAAHGVVSPKNSAHWDADHHPNSESYLDSYEGTRRD